jgi:hypothetical protein
MVELHRLSGNVYGVTGLFHLSKVGVNAGFVITKNSVIHIDAGMTVADGNYLLAQSRKKAKNKENLFLILTITQTTPSACEYSKKLVQK